jgi:hypothetical protein
VIIAQMLQWSDNRATDSLTRRYGFASLNALADTAGMTRTELRHRIGCSYDVPPKGGHNDLTLRDARRIYEGVENLTLLDSTRRTNLYSYLLGGAIGSTSTLAVMIRAEGAAAGLTTTEQNTFVANTVTRSKGGGYGLCPDGGGACNPAISQISTVGGIIWVRFKTAAGAIDTRPYVYGRAFHHLGRDVPQHRQTGRRNLVMA